MPRPAARSPSSSGEDERERIDLEMEDLAVDSFETTGARPDPREGRPHEVAMTVWDAR